MGGGPGRMAVTNIVARQWCKNIDIVLVVETSLTM
jgi:hypothetical protein